MATKKPAATPNNVPAKTKPQGNTLPAAFDYGEHEGRGFENQTRDDIAMPFVMVLQSGSPQVAKKEVAGAMPGHIYNTVTQELLEKLTYVPCCTEHCYIEWVPRDAGGGFVAKHDINSPVVAKAKAEAKKFNKLRVGKHDLVETYSIFLVLVDDEGQPAGYAVMSFESTKIKVYKAANTRIQMFMLRAPDGTKKRPPMYAHLCQATTVQESNAKGTWYNLVLAPAKGSVMDSLLPLDHPVVAAGAELYDLVQSGIANPAYGTAARDDDGGGEDDDPPF